MIKLHVLASGSGGNAAIVENGRTGEGVLIDCGICKRDFFERAGEAGFDTAKLRAVLITHDHSDHTKGLGVVLRGLAKAGCFPEVLASRAVYAASRPVREAAESVGGAGGALRWRRWAFRRGIDGAPFPHLPRCGGVLRVPL